MSTENILFDNENTSLLILNDDCLFHIFSYLTLNEQYKLSELCQRFDNIFKVNFKSNKCINFNDFLNMTVIESQRLIRKCEKSIKCLRYDMDEENCRFRSANNFGNFYPVYKFLLEEMNDVDLERLELSNLDEKPIIDFNMYKLIFEKMKNLKTIELSSCSITNEICSLIANCKNIQKLDLSNNYNISGEHISKMTNLIELNLFMCFELKPLHVISIIKSCRKLKNLKLETYSNNILNALIDYQANLEDLTLSISSDSMENIERISEIKSLKRLELYILSTEGILSDTFFVNLKENKSLTLEHLSIIRGKIHEYQKHQLYQMKNLQYLGVIWIPDIDNEFLENIANKMSLLTHINCSSCENITKYGILNLIKNSNIKLIDISSCFQFSDDLIIDIIELLKIMPQRTIKLIVGNTCISKYTLEKNPTYIENRHLIGISYKTTRIS